MLIACATERDGPGGDRSLKQSSLTPLTGHGRTPSRGRQATIRQLAAGLLFVCVFVSQSRGQYTAPTIDLGLPPGSEGGPVFRVTAQTGDEGIGSGGANGIAFGFISLDPFADVVIGDDLADLPDEEDNSGKAFLVFGAPAGQAGTIVSMNAAPGSGNSVFATGGFNNRFGNSVATGFISTPSIFPLMDVLIAERTGDPGLTDAGAVYVLSPGPAGIGLTGVTIDPTAVPAPPALVSTIAGGATGDWLGATLETITPGIVSTSDIAIGAPRATPLGRSEAGIVYVIPPAALPPPILGPASLALAPGTFTEVRIYGASPGDRLGTSIAADSFTDVDGDGFPDVVLGTQSAGLVYVVDGLLGMFGPGGLGTTGGVLSLAAAPGAFVRTTIMAPPSTGNFGWSVACGDVNGDGFADVVIGAPDIAGLFGPAVYIVYGAAGLPGLTFAVNAPPPGVFVTTILGDGNDETGYSVAVGDVGAPPPAAGAPPALADGVLDIIIGSRQGGAPPFGIPGVTRVIYGGAFLPATPVIDLSTTNPSQLVYGSSSSGEFGGGTVAGADVNADGRGDFAASARAGSYAAVVLGPGTIPPSPLAPVGLSTTASIIEHDRAGDAPWHPFGGPTSPTVRTMIDYDSGDSVSATTVTLHREAPPNIDFGTPFDEYWGISTDRTNYDATVTFRYANTELAALGESLVVYRSANGDPGTWTVAGSAQSCVPEMNMIKVEGLSEFSLFAVVGPQSPIPAVSEWGMIVMAVGLLCVATILLRRHPLQA